MMLSSVMLTLGTHILGRFPAGLAKGDPEKQEPDERLNIVGMRAHAAAHSHSHPEGHHECVDVTHPHTHGHMGHSSEDTAAHIRHIVIAQVSYVKELKNISQRDGVKIS